MAERLGRRTARLGLISTASQAATLVRNKDGGLHEMPGIYDSAIKVEFGGGVAPRIKNRLAQAQRLVQRLGQKGFSVKGTGKRDAYWIQQGNAKTLDWQRFLSGIQTEIVSQQRRSIRPGFRFSLSNLLPRLGRSKRP